MGLKESRGLRGFEARRCSAANALVRERHLLSKGGRAARFFKECTGKLCNVLGSWSLLCSLYLTMMYLELNLAMGILCQASYGINLRITTSLTTST